MAVFEAALRGGAVFLLILLAVLLVRDARQIAAARFAAFFALGVACYAVVSASEFAAGLPAWLLPLRFVAMGNPVVFCLFAAALFDDDFKPSWWQGLAWLAVVAVGASCLWIGTPAARIGFSTVGLACNAVGAWYALAERSLDLVEQRRRLRGMLVVVIAFYATAIIASEILYPGGSGGPALGMAISAGVLAIVMVFAAALFVVNRDGSLIPFDQSEPQPLAVTPRRPAAAAGVVGQSDDEGAPMLLALRRLMEHDRAYREEGLSIGGLAGRLGIAEHALRRLINQRLGHRNFNAFLNGYRLDEVAAALADPAQEAVPILTIALDAGFQSLGPFNRAFKSRTGMTPSEFRREQLVSRFRSSSHFSEPRFRTSESKGH
ncbi:AraC family transcriptional regulator [Bradyrhizobium sp.]|uniref:helix-turn-helix domain-containing protein n=1 Tax=Bradyrhizobium sp. TaxID=376 RepID=UPI00262FD183|nr:AraC family transcriptional regulator [Bradyrhizobium sp.]